MEFIYRDSRWLDIRPPVNLDAEDHSIFPPGLGGTIPCQKIDVLQDAEVAGRGPIRHQGQYLPESFVIPSQLETWKKRGGQTRQRLENLVSRRGSFEGPAIWITDNWSFGYYHWFCDALPRLELALKHVAPSEATLILPYKARRCSFIGESLQAFGLRDVRYLNRFERLRCSELILPSHIAPTGSHAPDLVDQLRNRLRRFVDQPASIRSDRIYVSRSQATRRRVVNDTELSETLAKLGFTTIVAERMGWREQIACFRDAACMVSNHGAGLTNMLVMPSTASVLEIRERENTTQGCYWGLASALELDYHYCLADKTKSHEGIHTADVIANCDDVAATVCQMIDHSRVSAA